ncbi:MAG: hypothetical protein JWM68_2085 [Verrucomicrobiales bacterium]|nr:hypothetical protein [Verrucomicrobiales bacterium]
MKSDPLAQWRKTSASTQPPNSVANPTPPVLLKKEGAYVAFEAKDRVDRLRIRRANDPTRTPHYQWLLDITHDEIFGENFVLVFTFIMVLVRGKNLKPVVDALEKGMASYIQEFDPDRWDKPTDDKAPFIQSIEVRVTGSERAVAEAEKLNVVKH